MCKQHPLLIPFQFFGGQPAHALNETAFDLTAVYSLVNRISHVVEDIHPQDTMHPSKAIHFNLRDGGTASKIMEWLAPTGCAIPMNSRCAIIARSRETDSFEISLFDNFRQRNSGSRALNVPNHAISKLYMRRIGPFASFLLQ